MVLVLKYIMFLVFLLPLANLVTNGTFDSNVNSWTAGHANASITWDSGRMKTILAVAVQGDIKR